jgi:LAO/AO transport system kinase
VVVTVPGLGDEIQAIKAGILEIADVLVVNKADREGADRQVRDLVAMLELRGHDAAPVEIVRTVATTAQGIPDLIQAVERHRARGQRTGGLPERQKRRAEATLRELVVDRLRRSTDGALASQPELIEQVATRTTDPYTAADALVRAITSAK